LIGKCSSPEDAVEGLLARGVDIVGLSVVHLIWGHEANAEMVMILIIPCKKMATESLGVLDAAELLGELGLIFHGLEMAFRE
jgi:hypothetical protein